MSSNSVDLPPLIVQVFGYNFMGLERTWVKGGPYFALIFDCPYQRIPIGDTNKLYSHRHVRVQCYGARGCAVACKPSQWPEVMKLLFDRFLINSTCDHRLVAGLRRYVEAHPISDAPSIDMPFRRGNAILVYGPALLQFLRPDWNLSRGDLYRILKGIGAWSAQVRVGDLRKYWWHIPKDRLDLEKDRNTDT